MIDNDNTSSPHQTAEGLQAHVVAILGTASAWLLPLLIIALAWFGVIQPWRSQIADLQQRVAEKTQRLAHIKTALQRARGFSLKQKERLSKLAASDLLPPGDPSLVLADLQTGIGKVISEHGGTMLEVRPEKPKPENAAVRLGLFVRFRAPVEKAFRILYAIESGRPLLFIDKASVRLFGDPRNRLLIAGKMHAQLLAEIHVHGYQIAKGAVK